MAKKIQLPGVYVTEVANANLAVAGANLISVGLVGTSSDEFEVNDLAVLCSGDATDTVSAIDANYLVSIDVISDYSGARDTNLTKYTLTTDYTVSGNVITWVGSNRPTAGATFYVSYTRTKSDDYYEPIVYSTMDEVRAVHGPELDNGTICPISAAANLILSSGAQRLVIVQAADGSNTAQKDALDLLKTEDVQIIVMPGITDTALQTYLKSHVVDMSSTEEAMERIGFIAPNGLSDSVDTIIAQSESMIEQRIINIAPPRITTTFKDNTTGTDTSMTLSSIYAGASIAGSLANPNRRLALPLTRKQVNNIDTLGGIKYNRTQKETLAGGGTLVMYSDNNVIKVNQGLTTDPTNYNTREISVVMIKDEIRRELRQICDPYVGTEFSDTSVDDVKAALVTGLQTMNGTLITGNPGYQNLIVKKNATNPEAIDVSVDVAVIRPLNYINIKFTAI